MLGVSTSSFYGKLTTEDAVYKIADMGARCAEVFLNTFSEYENEYINMVGSRMKEKGLLFSSVHTLPTQFEPQLFAATKRQKEDAQTFFKEVLKASAQNGCNTYVMHGKPFFKKNVGSFSVDFDAVSKRLNELCLIAEDYGVTIALENVHWAMCNNLDFIAAVKGNVPDLRFTLDIKQAHLSGIPFEEYIRAFGSKLTNVHICDYLGKSTCLPGKGEVNFRRLANCLNDVGYNGNVIVEVYNENYSSYEELKGAIEYCGDFFSV